MDVSHDVTPGSVPGAAELSISQNSLRKYFKDVFKDRANVGEETEMKTSAPSVYGQETM